MVIVRLIEVFCQDELMARHILHRPDDVRIAYAALYDRLFHHL
jgi:hypothetical protein